MTRRKFFPALAFTLGAPTLLTASQSTVAKKNETPEPEKIESPESSTMTTMRWIDPNLSNLIVNLSYLFGQAMIFYNLNYKKLQSGSKDITEADLIHNVSDKWSNAYATAISGLLSYSVRLPFTAYYAQSSSDGTDETKRKNKVWSDFATINTYYSQKAADRYLTNAFQDELREVYKKILQENPQYQCKPWAIPQKTIIKALKEILPQLKDEMSSDIKTSSGKLKNLLSTRRNRLDLLLISLSYIGTFVDIIPLVSANKIPIDTANTGTGRAIGSLPANGFLNRDLLKRLKERGDLKGFNEQKVLATATIYNGPLYFSINSIVQSSFDSVLNLKEKSDSDVAYLHVREAAGVIIGGIIFTIVQYQLETSFRSNIKESSKDESKKNLAAQFADWYFEPPSN